MVRQIPVAIRFGRALARAQRSQDLDAESPGAVMLSSRATVIVGLMMSWRCVGGRMTLP
jgi:hypothetical protein